MPTAAPEPRQLGARSGLVPTVLVIGATCTRKELIARHTMRRAGVAR